MFGNIISYGRGRTAVSADPLYRGRGEQVGRVNGKGCVGTVVDLHCSWRFFVDSGHFVFRKVCDVCGASGTRNECKKRCQESLEIIKI